MDTNVSVLATHTKLSTFLAIPDPFQKPVSEYGEHTLARRQKNRQGYTWTPTPMDTHIDKCRHIEHVHTHQVHERYVS